MPGSRQQRAGGGARRLRRLLAVGRAGGKSGKQIARGLLRAVGQVGHRQCDKLDKIAGGAAYEMHSRVGHLELGALEMAVGTGGGGAGGLGCSLAAGALDHVVCRAKCWAGSGQAGERMGGWQRCTVQCMGLPSKICPPLLNPPLPRRPHSQLQVTMPQEAMAQPTWVLAG